MALPLALTSFVRSDGRFMGEEGLSTNSTVAVVVGTVLLRCAPLSVFFLKPAPLSVGVVWLRSVFLSFV